MRFHYVKEYARLSYFLYTCNYPISSDGWSRPGESVRKIGGNDGSRDTYQHIYIYIYTHTYMCNPKVFFYVKNFCLNGFSKFFVVCKYRLSWLWVLYLYDFVMSFLCLGCGIEKLRLHLDFGNQFLKVFVLHSNVLWKLTM